MRNLLQADLEFVMLWDHLPNFIGNSTKSNFILHCFEP